MRRDKEPHGARPIGVRRPRPKKTNMAGRLTNQVGDAGWAGLFASDTLVARRQHYRRTVGKQGSAGEGTPEVCRNSPPIYTIRAEDPVLSNNSSACPGRSRCRLDGGVMDHEGERFDLGTGTGGDDQAL